ncbi:peptidylprolyl isomerase [Candidatus Woesearchaeota archaeon]|nr:peptidylprolyl isomerase [Candidatus Woesearchaeota archaeon]MBW3014498.1 peptidylprolyl isomerase [Candidatus Woesearchaeota archaeon]
MTKIETGKKVILNYTGKFEDDTVFDSSYGREPIEFEYGSGKVIKGLETGIKGLKKGDQKKLHIKPEDAYGIRDPKKLLKVPIAVLGEDARPKIGMEVSMRNRSDGSTQLAKIESIGKDTMTLDLNHPLAGKSLIFEVEIVDIK